MPLQRAEAQFDFDPTAGVELKLRVSSQLRVTFRWVVRRGLANAARGEKEGYQIFDFAEFVLLMANHVLTTP